jgi:nucleotide-binding universal stress UspA family protein
MSIKSILANYSGDAKGSSGLGLALHMAKKYDAHITGVVWRGPSFTGSRLRPYMTKDILNMLAARESEAMAEIKVDFDARIAADGDPARSAFIDLADRSEFSLAECARGYDIVVIGSRAAAFGREYRTSRPDVVALWSGRPVILVPHDFTVESLGDNALVAWDGKRAAARALGDAIRILQTKARVTVLTIGNELPRGPGDDVVALLRKHGVVAEPITRRAGRGGIAATILDACKEQGAGLLVMGAYEHSKFSEDILGGVTQTILEEAHIPVLMSH